MTITSDHYKTLDEAFLFFNSALFNNDLPECLITLQRTSHSKGYYSPDQFKSRFMPKTVDEIALNPDVFASRTDEEILSTLVHEMVHLWQQHFDIPPRGNYHNRRWANKMLSIGLIPSSTGEPDGKQTGQSMTHYIEPGGLFQTEAARFLAAASLEWNAAGTNSEKLRKSNSSKTKFSCPSCGCNAWAKPTARLICGECEEEMEPEG